MSEKIPQSFKVQWLNKTMKFIKDDDQLLMQYPKMPWNHVYYLHNVMWQRKNDVGLGFKTLHAPLWEAINIFSLKYHFKVSVIKSLLDDTGQLVIEKISKTTFEDNKKVNPAEKENYNTELQLQNELINISGKLKNTEELHLQNEPINISNKLKNSEELQLQNEPININRKLKNSEKYFIDKRKIIDSISSMFLRTSLQKILDFVNDEVQASIVFSDLAPIEARFLENFLGIYNRRTVFQSLLSPSCNDILNKISISLKKIDKICKLEVGAVKTDYATKKREVTFLKVPKYIIPTKTKAKLITFNTSQVEGNQDNDIVDLSSKFLNALNFQEKGHAQSDEKKNPTGKKALINDNSKTEKQKISKIDQETNKSNISIENSRKVTLENSDTGNEVANTNTSIDNKKVANNIDEDLKKTVKSKNVEKCKKGKDKTTDNKPINIDKRAEFLKDSKDVKKPNFTKASDSINHNDFISTPNTNIGTLCQRKTKLLEDMSTPLESEKGIRMMRMMGWDGGALGLRGGILEPIIPILSHATGAGLGHVSERLTRKQAKVDFHLDALKAILDILEKNIQSCIIKYDRELNKKEKKSLTKLMDMFNSREKINFPSNLHEAGNRIIEIMKAETGYTLDLVLSSDKKEIKFTKKATTAIETPTKVKKKKKKNKRALGSVKIPGKKRDFIHLILKKFLELVQLKQKSINVDFDDVLEDKHCKTLEKICESINNREPVSGDDFGLGSEILADIGKKYLNIMLYDDGLSILLEIIKRGRLDQIIKKRAEGKQHNNLAKKPKEYEQVVKVVEENINNKTLVSTNENSDLCKDCDKNKGSCKNSIETKPVLENNNTIKLSSKVYTVIITDDKNILSGDLKKTIQNVIAEKSRHFFPILKCHGVADNKVIYSCQNYESYLWLKKVLCNFKITDYKSTNEKLILQIVVNTSFGARRVLDMLEKCNLGISCKKWFIIDERGSDPLVFRVEVDDDSFDFICDNNFKLFAGVDDAHFFIRF